MLWNKPHISSCLNFTQRMQCANPCSLILIIQGATATDHSCLENQSGTKYNKFYCIAIKNYSIYKNMFQWHGIQPNHPAVIISTIHLLLFISQSLTIYSFKFTPSWYFHSQFCLKWTINQKASIHTTIHCVVRENLNFGSRVCRIFPVINYVVLIIKSVRAKANFQQTDLILAVTPE